MGHAIPAPEPLTMLQGGQQHVLQTHLLKELHVQSFADTLTSILLKLSIFSPPREHTHHESM